MKQNLDRLAAMFILMIVLNVAVVAQSQVDEGTANLPGTGVISGRVITENGQPLENVTVYVHAWNSQGQPNTATTDSDGRFQVTGLDPALYLVQASAQSYVAASREPGSVPAYYRIGDSVTITLVKGGVISGTVTSASGEPLVMTGVRAVLIRNPEGQRYPIRQIERTTDDRGIYRLYGLQPGTYLVSAGGRGAFSFYGNTYDTDMPTYAPSATRDTATEINVRSGEERGGVDIRYRGEPGHVVSGSVSGPTAATGPYSGANVNLTQILNGTRVGGPNASQASESRGFLIYGVGDGDYELTAVSALSLNEVAMSEPRRITVKGADITSLDLITKPLGSISGRLTLENSTSPECKGKRKPLFPETLILVQNNSKEPARDDLLIYFSARQTPPDKSGDVVFTNLVAGQYRFDLHFLAKYWYLKTIIQPAATAPTGSKQTPTANRPVDVARNGISLKHGERLSGLTFTLAEGAASLRGSIKLAEGERVPAQLYLHLVPSEKDTAEDVLRYFAASVNADGTFTLGNLAPGRYGILTRLVEDREAQWVTKLRLPDESQLRSQLRREADAAKTEIEFKPCQNVTNYQLPLKASISSVDKQSATAP